MLLHQFPDLQWLKAQASARFANRQGVGGIRLPNEGWPTVVMNTKAREVVRDNIQGPLSIFTNLSGHSEVTVEKRRVRIRPGTYFISNTGQPYTLEIHEKPVTETFNIHFGESFTEAAVGSLVASPEWLLENVRATAKIGFHNRVVLSDDSFQKTVRAIQAGGHDPLYLEEQLFQLLGLLVEDEVNMIARRERLPALKSSTKEEIMKRLMTATDYLYTFYDKNPGLDELAAVSCLSKFHFLRLFRIAYHQTPHQFITSLKIQRAKELLNTTKDEVKTIADSLGFENSSSFSRTFYKVTGIYPSQFRGS